MVRKQLYIEERQERALKRRAKALGVSEADIVRQALDAVLETERNTVVVPGHQQALRELLERATEFSSSRRHAPRTSRYRREELYEERENRWVRRS